MEAERDVDSLLEKYGCSKLATLISAIGAMTRYGGVAAIFAGEAIGAGVVIVAVGVGMHFLAEHVNESKEERIRRSGR